MAIDPNLKTSCKRLGAMLTEEGLVTEGQLQEALRKQNAEGGFLGKLLVDLGYLDESDLINLLVKQCKIPHISLLDYDIKKELVNRVSKDICLTYGVLPVDQLGSILTVAMVDPLDVEALESVRQACPDLRIKPILCSWRHYEQVTQKLFNMAPRDVHEASLDSLGLSGGGASRQSGSQTGETSESIPEAQVEEAGASSDDSSAALEDEITEAMGDQAGAPTAEAIELVRAIDDDIRYAVQLGVDIVAERLREQLAVRGSDLGVGTSDLIEAVRRSMNDAIDEAVSALLYQVQQALIESRTQAGTLSVQQLSDVLRLSMRRAINDSSADVLDRVAKSILDKDSEAG